MEKLSRKGFLKVAAAAAMSGVTAAGLAACNNGKADSTLLPPATRASIPRAPTPLPRPVPVP